MCSKSKKRKKNRYLKSRITNLNSLLEYLKRNSFIIPSAESVIQASLPGSASEILTRILKGASHEKYSPLLRSFALTLHFYSPKAYEFLRNTFNKSLPHPRTISKWYSTIDRKPGFTSEALRAIDAKIKIKNKQIYVNLVFDEVYIMKKVEWTGKQIVGYINFGAKLQSDGIPEATQALVFMVVTLNDCWKIPVGYFFIESLTGDEKATLLTECLVFLSQTNIKVTSVTFHGATANITMMRRLGAIIDVPSALVTHFPHPITHHKVYFFLDPSHMIKLVRNTLGSCGDGLFNGQNDINWKFLEYLVQLLEREGLLAGTKLKKRHL